MKNASGNSQRHFSFTVEIFESFYYTLLPKDKIAGFLFYFLSMLKSLQIVFKDKNTITRISGLFLSLDTL